MGNVLNRGWLALNEGRPYPLAPWASRSDTTGTFSIPNDFLVELVWPLSPGSRMDPTLLYLSQIISTPTVYSVSIGYSGPPAIPIVATATTIAGALATEYVPVPLTGVGAFADAVGRIVIGSARGMGLQPSGSFTFDLGAAQLDLDCVRPATAGVSAIYVQNGQEILGPLQGDVMLSSGTGVELGVVAGGVTVSAVTGTGASTCPCPGGVVAAVPVASINGVATAGGILDIVGDACITVTTTAQGVALADACSTPCCGPTELAALEAELASLQGAVDDLRRFVAELQSSQAAMTQNVLASKIGDQGCVSCD